MIIDEIWLETNDGSMGWMERKSGKGREDRKDWNDEKDEDTQTRPNTAARAQKQRAIDMPIFPFSASVKQFGCQYHHRRNLPETIFTAQGWQRFLLDKEEIRKEEEGTWYAHWPYHAASSTSTDHC